MRRPSKPSSGLVSIQWPCRQRNPRRTITPTRPQRVATKPHRSRFPKSRHRFRRKPLPISTPKGGDEAPPKPVPQKPAPVQEKTTPNPPLKFRLEKLEREHAYLTERGLTLETIISFGVGYCGKGMMAGRIAINEHERRRNRWRRATRAATKRLMTAGDDAQTAKPVRAWIPWIERTAKDDRSEEHTSELQSRQYLVC